jgi:hypothetical protein
MALAAVHERSSARWPRQPCPASPSTHSCSHGARAIETAVPVGQVVLPNVPISGSTELRLRRAGNLVVWLAYQLVGSRKRSCGTVRRSLLKLR